MVTHFDRCLGCMACVTACPSGVRYDRLIERVRPQVERHHERPPAERALRAAAVRDPPPPPAAARAGAAAGRAPASSASSGCPTAWRSWPRSPRGPRSPQSRDQDRPSAPRRSASSGAASACCSGCVQRVFYPTSTGPRSHVLAAEGFEVLAPRQPDCCGALELHGGAEAAAITRAQATIAAFARGRGRRRLDHVVVNAAGCGSAMKEYGELLDTPEAQGLLGPGARRLRAAGLASSRGRRAGPVPLRVAYHDACHLAHAQGVRAQPRALLDGDPGARAGRGRAPSASCAAARPGSTTSSSPRPPPSSARARPGT